MKYHGLAFLWLWEKAKCLVDHIFFSECHLSAVHKKHLSVNSRKPVTESECSWGLTSWFLSLLCTGSVTLCALVYRTRCKLWFCFLSIWNKHCFPRFSLHGTGNTAFSGLLWVSGHSWIFIYLIIFSFSLCL